MVDADGRLLYQATTRGEQRFPEQVARNVTETMLEVAERDGLALPGGRPVAAKTGTVESRLAGQNNDAWMAGFTPELATSVWMGTDRNAPIRTAGRHPDQRHRVARGCLAGVHDRGAGQRTRSSSSARSSRSASPGRRPAPPVGHPERVAVQHRSDGPARHRAEP